MKVVFDCQGNLRSEEFLKDETHRFLGYGGAKGGAKSWSLRAKALKRRLDHPGSTGLLLRRTWQEIYDNHIVFVEREWTPFGRFDKQNSRFVFENGSVQYFSYARREEEVREKHYGIERDDIGIDEATQQAEGSIHHLNSCVRATVSGIKPQLWLATNPGGKGHGWFKRWFITKEYDDGQDPKDYYFIPAKVDDNKVLLSRDPGYVRELEKLPPDLRRMLRDGDWDVFAGQAFPELRRHIHGFSDVLPDNWPVVVAYDWGYEKPYAVIFARMDYDGRFWQFHEIYGYGGKANLGSSETVDAVADKVQKFLQDNKIIPQIHLAGPDFFAKGAASGMMKAKAYADVFREKGIYLTEMPTPAGSRIQGKMAVHSRLAGDRPGLMINTISCPHTWRTLPELVYDENGSGDVDTDGEDHIYDSIRHLCRWREWGKPIENDKKTVSKDQKIIQKILAGDYPISGPAQKRRL